MVYFDNKLLQAYLIDGNELEVYDGFNLLTITTISDISHSKLGYGIDTNGKTISFRYNQLQFILVNDNKMTLDTLQKELSPEDPAPEGEEAEEGGEEDAPPDDPKKEESIQVGMAILNTDTLHPDFNTQGHVSLVEGDHISYNYWNTKRNKMKSVLVERQHVKILH